MSRVWLLATITMLLVICGCSATQHIATGANEIRAEARQLINHGNATNDPEVVSRAEHIDTLAAGIHADLAGTTDKIPAWVSMLTWIAIAVVGIAMLLIGWQSGIFSGLRLLIGWLPRKKVSQAELAVDMLDPNRPEGEREYVAAMRAQDPEFDAAFRAAQERRKAKT
jgi:hypothetical protein